MINEVVRWPRVAMHLFLRNKSIFQLLGETYLYTVRFQRWLISSRPWCDSISLTIITRLNNPLLLAKLDSIVCRTALPTFCQNTPSFLRIV